MCVCVCVIGFVCAIEELEDHFGNVMPNAHYPLLSCISSQLIVHKE